MKILIMSDSHHLNKVAQEVIKLEKPDMFIHCGDFEGDEARFEEWVGAPKVPCAFVRGNNDWSMELPNTRVFTMNKHKFFVTHGHMQHVHGGLHNLRFAAEENGCDIVIFGHTHMVCDEEAYGIRFLNPGSISLPRGSKKKTYMIMELDESGEYTVKTRYVDTV